MLITALKFSNKINEKKYFLTMKIHFFQSLVVGDVIYAQVMGKSAAGLLLKILCNCSDCPRVVPDLGVKVSILFTTSLIFKQDF